MHSTPKLYHLYKSSNSSKKFDVYVENHRTGRTKKVSFGAKDYEDYSIHKDKERRRRYRIRHQHDNIDDYLSPGFWSWYILWGRSTSISKNMTYVKNMLDV